MKVQVLNRPKIKSSNTKVYGFRHLRDSNSTLACQRLIKKMSAPNYLVVNELWSNVRSL